MDRIVPKERLYAEGKASSALRQRFIDEVRRIRWAYKLGEESLRLAPGNDVTEIQVIVIELKSSELDSSILFAIDRSIPSQVIFELRREDGTRPERAMAAAYKRTAGKVTKGTDHFRTGWVGDDEPREPLPTALDMDGLYAQLLARMLPHPLRPSEELPEALTRMKRIRTVEREISALEKRVRTEPQFNRKVALRNDLRAKQAEFAGLTAAHGVDTVPTGEQRDTAWRS